MKEGTQSSLEINFPLLDYLIGDVLVKGIKEKGSPQSHVMSPGIRDPPWGGSSKKKSVKLIEHRYVYE